MLIVQLTILAPAALFAWRMHQRLEAGEKKLQDLSQRLQRVQQEAASKGSQWRDVEVAGQQGQQLFDFLGNLGQTGKVVTPLIIPESRKPELPPGWVPFKFNGLTYYYTPLSGSPLVSVNNAR